MLFYSPMWSLFNCVHTNNVWVRTDQLGQHCTDVVTSLHRVISLGCAAVSSTSGTGIMPLLVSHFILKILCRANSKADDWAWLLKLTQNDSFLFCHLRVQTLIYRRDCRTFESVYRPQPEMWHLFFTSFVSAHCHCCSLTLIVSILCNMYKQHMNTEITDYNTV